MVEVLGTPGARHDTLCMSMSVMVIGAIKCFTHTANGHFTPLCCAVRCVALEWQLLVTFPRLDGLVVPSCVVTNLWDNQNLEATLHLTDITNGQITLIIAIIYLPLLVS